MEEWFVYHEQVYEDEPGDIREKDVFLGSINATSGKAAHEHAAQTWNIPGDELFVCLEEDKPTS